MALPKPRPGLVIGYAYLWREEAARGQSEGTKDRPCVVVLSVRHESGEPVVTVAPITHAPPRLAGDAVELPAETKRRLGLDTDRSWIVATEVNQFVWPGSDLRPVSAKQPRTFAFGFLPMRLFEALRSRMLENARAHRLGAVARDATP